MAVSHSRAGALVFISASAVPSPRGTLIVQSSSRYLCFPGDGFKGNKLECDFHLTQSPKRAGGGTQGPGRPLLWPLAPRCLVITDAPVGTQLG